MYDDTYRIYLLTFCWYDILFEPSEHSKNVLSASALSRIIRKSTNDVIRVCRFSTAASLNHYGSGMRVDVYGHTFCFSNQSVLTVIILRNPILCVLLAARGHPTYIILFLLEYPPKPLSSLVLLHHVIFLSLQIHHHW